MRPGHLSPRWRFSLVYLLISLAVLAILQHLLFPPLAPQEVPYSRFLTALENRTVERVAISESQVLWTEKGQTRPFVARRLPDVADQDLIARLRQSGAEFGGFSERSWLIDLLSWLVPVALLGALWWYLLPRVAGQPPALTFGRNRARIYDQGTVTVTFADVAGVDEAVAELREVVDFLKDPEKYRRLGGRIPKGVLLVGPPGTGKTLLARATAGEAGVPFFALSGSEFVEMFVGVGAARVRDLFEQAKRKAPCIIFIDEIDTIGRHRSGVATIGANEEREQTLNQLLVEMDGFEANTGVIIMAATNRPDLLDPALLRPGRFDRTIVVDRPDLPGREAILRVHTRQVKLAPDVDLRVIAARTPGFVGADLANIVNEAALLAARRGKEAVGMAEFEEAIDRVTAGLERRSRVLTERERDIVAVHELGHALAALLLPNADPVHKVSIIARGPAALGLTTQVPTEDRHLYTEAELHDRLAVLLGGRAAEEIIFGQVSTGAAHDLQQATHLARQMVRQYGLSPAVGLIALPDEHGPFLSGPATGVPAGVSEDLARVMDREVQRLLAENYARVRQLLERHRTILRALADELKAREVMDGRELRRRFYERLRAQQNGHGAAALTGEPEAR